MNIMYDYSTHYTTHYIIYSYSTQYISTRKLEASGTSHDANFDIFPVCTVLLYNVTV